MSKMIEQIETRRARRGLSNKHRELEHSARDRKPEDQVIMYNRWVQASAEQQ